MNKLSGLVFLGLLFILLTPVHLASAALDDSSNGGDLFLSCREDDDCVLTRTPVGEELLTGDVQANPATPEHVVLEFEMDPGQNELALLPQVVKEMQIDLRLREDLTGWSRPDLDVTLILAHSVTTWSFEGDLVPSQTANEPYRLEDAGIHLNDQRMIWPGQTVKLRLEFTIDRISTWELHMRGESFLKLDIPWSEDMESRNVDEPSSDISPVESEFEMVHYGALVENDRDCWRFEVEQHEVLRVIIEWEAVPIEVEQSHGLPDLITPVGRQAEAPDVVTESDDEKTRITYRWRALPLGEYTFCIGGKAGAFQPYKWSGILGFEGIGPTDPGGFGEESFYPNGYASFGDEELSTELELQSRLPFIFGILSVVGFMVPALKMSTSFAIRFGLFTPGVLMLLVGGVVHPMWALADEVQLDDELTLDDLVDLRLQQLWDVSYPGIPEQTLIEHTGATWGMLSGEKLKLRLEIDEVREMPDGRYQLIIPELQEFRLDEAIFAQVAKGGAQTTDEGLLEEQTVSFILLAGRSLLLDLLILEAVMVVDEVPESSVFHFETNMVASKYHGSESVPAWGTRPTSVSQDDWIDLQTGLFPERIAVSLCDCDMDLLDVRFTPSNGFDLGDVPQVAGIRNAHGLLDTPGYVAVGGFLLCLVATNVEWRRAKSAKQLAEKMFSGTNKWN